MRADVVIQARPERVWGILSDLDRYGDWNPFFVQAKGKLAPGEVLHLVMQPVGKGEKAFAPKVLEVEPGKHLAWRGRLGIPKLFDGEHHLRLEVVDAGRVRLIQEEHFSGILVPFVGFEPYRLGWLRMNEAIKRRAEAQEMAQESP
jgi:hypothetical protein